MELQLGDTSPLRRNVEEIIKAAERASGLTQQLLAFSRKKPLQPKILDLNSLVIDMGQMLRRLIGAHLDLTTQLASDLGKIRVDQGQMEQVILNLVVNARDAMPQGGKLSIETSNILIDEVQAKGLPFLRPGPHVILTISDTGVGMDDETRRQMFEPFFTTKDPGKGTGLGLSTVYSVVNQSGGVIGVQSAPGKGSTFKIYLPQATEEPSEPVVETSENQDCEGTDTILVVEDEEPLLILTCDALAENGYTVLAARDGVQAQEIAKSFQGPIHLLLTDVSMPRMGGSDLAQEMISLRPGIRILFMTAYSEREPALTSNLCRTESLSKPFSRNVLLQKVRQMLDRAEIAALP
jgi:CheY-like chemotaxis protein